MDKQRHSHYKQAISIIDTLGPSKLHPDEHEVLRDAAEGLLLSSDPSEIDSLRKAARVQLDSLVGSGRWLPDTADELLGEISACGPVDEESAVLA